MAWSEGYEAAANGYDREDNPYVTEDCKLAPAGSLAREWFDGYDFRVEEAKE